MTASLDERRRHRRGLAIEIVVKKWPQPHWRAISKALVGSAAVEHRKGSSASTTGRP